jgi:hypothetical protein
MAVRCPRCGEFLIVEVRRMRVVRKNKVARRRRELQRSKERRARALGSGGGGAPRVEKAAAPPDEYPSAEPRGKD